MKILGRRMDWRAITAFGIACVLSTALWAGGSGFDDDHDHSEDEGPAFFGFVKDTRGAAIPDAKVSVSTKAGELITRSNILGAYRVPGFRKDVDPETVQIVCEKAGYKFVRTLRRSQPNKSATTPIETECVLQRA
jgi:hypothetical protein